MAVERFVHALRAAMQQQYNGRTRWQRFGLHDNEPAFDAGDGDRLQRQFQDRGRCQHEGGTSKRQRNCSYPLAAAGTGALKLLLSAEHMATNVVYQRRLTGTLCSQA